MGDDAKTFEPLPQRTPDLSPLNSAPDFSPSPGGSGSTGFQTAAGNMATQRAARAEGDDRPVKIVERMPTIPDPAYRYVVQLPEKRYDFSFDYHRIPMNFHGLTPGEVVKKLSILWRFCHDDLDEGRAWNEYLVTRREEHRTAVFWSDFFGGADLPDPDMWNDIGRGTLWDVKKVIDSTDEVLRAHWEQNEASTNRQIPPELQNNPYMKAALAFDASEQLIKEAESLLRKAAEELREKQRIVDQYVKDSKRGAERAITGINVAIVVLSAAATGGGAGFAGKGASLIASSSTSALTAGGVGAATQFATQIGEMRVGDREAWDFDFKKIAKRGVSDTVNGFIGGVVGGKFSQVLKGRIGGWVGGLSDETLTAYGITKEELLTNGEKLFIDWVAGVGSTPATTLSNQLMHRALEGEWECKSFDDFAGKMFDDMVEGGALSGFLQFGDAYLTHGGPRGGGTTDRAAESPPPRPEVRSPTQELAASESAPVKRGSPQSETATPSLKTPGTGPPQDVTQVTGPPAGAVFQAVDPHHPVKAFRLYQDHIAADPLREVALIYNHTTDHWAVVQGDRGSVNAIEGMKALGWEAKDSSAARHYHPVGVGNQTSEHNQLPTGRGADLTVIEGNAPGGGDSQWHTIDVTTATGPDRTWVVRTKEGLWTVDYPDHAERGGRGSVSFTSAEQYHKWFRNRFGFSPDKAPAPAAAALNTPDNKYLADLNEKIVRLIEGKDLPPLPEAGPSMQRSDMEVELGRKILADPHSTPENQHMAIETLVKRAVAEYRAKRSAEKELRGDGPELSAQNLEGCCGVGRDLTADSIITLLGDSPHAVMLERFQVMDLGIAEQHEFSIVTAPDGSRILVDPTFAQFGLDVAKKPTGGALLGKVTAKTLLENGMVPLDAKSAREYAMALGADARNVEAVATALLSGDGAVLTEIVQNKKVHRTTEGPIQNIIELQRTIFGVHGEDVTSHGEIRELLSKLPADDPRRPLLDSLASRLEQLAEYQAELPEIPDNAPIAVGDLPE